MPGTDFDEFVRRLRSEEEAHKSIDWNGRRENWIAQLLELHQTLKMFIRPYIDQGTIRIASDGELLTEEHVGSYIAPKLMLRIGEREIAIVPRGMNVIGAAGRADIVGPGGEISLVLVATKEHPMDRVWKIVQRDRKVELIDLTKDRFLAAVMRAADA